MNKELREIFEEVAFEVEEVFVDSRKGIAQSVYIAGVAQDATYWDGNDMVPVPEELKGNWMMAHPDDLRYFVFSEMVQDEHEEWIKCEPRQVTKTEWVAV